MVIPESVTNIENEAFNDCTGLTSVTIPAGVKKVWSTAFSQCTGLTEILADPNNSVYHSADGMLLERDCLLTCPAGKTGSVTIPAGAAKVWGTAFSKCTGLTEILTDANNSVYRSVDGMLLEKDCLRICPAGKTGNVTIPEGVTEIGGRAFYRCAGLTGITIPEGVKQIGLNAFSLCTGLTSVTIPKSVKRLDWDTFAGCTSLKSVVLHAGITKIQDDAFLNCSALTSVALPEKLKELGNLAFYGCSSLESITIPARMSKIGLGVVDRCDRLKRIVFYSVPCCEYPSLSAFWEDFGYIHTTYPYPLEKTLEIEFHETPEKLKEILELAKNAILYIPGVPISEIIREWQPAAVRGFARLYQENAEMDEDIRAGYLKFIKGRKKRLCPLVVEHEELLQLMLAEKMFPRKDVDVLLAECDKQSNAAAKAAVMDYINTL